MGYPIIMVIGAVIGSVASAWVTTVSQDISTLALRLLIVFLITALLIPISIALPCVAAAAALGQALVLGPRYHWETVVLAAIVTTLLLFVFVEIRHATLRRRRLKHPLSSAAFRRRGLKEKRGERSLYALAILGSGGHTKEMLLMMGNDFRESEQSHRRYVVTSGDEISLKQAEAFERDLRESKGQPGTYDIRVATRARRVHQPLLTTPVSALRSIIDIFPILLARPGQITSGPRLELPDVIFTNGPATGFFVGLVAHMLKIFYFVPEHKMQVLFIESWARVSSLSLTGKLFHYTGIADMFLVQHEAVANIYGVLNAGWLVLPPSQRRKNTQ